MSKTLESRSKKHSGFSKIDIEGFNLFGFTYSFNGRNLSKLLNNKKNVKSVAFFPKKSFFFLKLFQNV